MNTCSGELYQALAFPMLSLLSGILGYYIGYNCCSNDYQIAYNSRNKFDSDDEEEFDDTESEDEGIDDSDSDSDISDFEKDEEEENMDKIIKELKDLSKVTPNEFIKLMAGPEENKLKLMTETSKTLKETLEGKDEKEINEFLSKMGKKLTSSLMESFIVCKS